MSGPSWWRASLRPIGAGVVTGGMLAASMPPAGATFFAWIAFWPLLATCSGRSFGLRILSGSTAGIVFGAASVGPWLLAAVRSHLASDTLSAAVLTLAAAWLYGGMYVAALAVLYPWLPRPRWIAAPAAWVLLEWVRTWALGGAPWALLGHSQHDWGIAQIAEIGGVPAISFLVMLVSAALAESGRSRAVALAMAAVAIAAAASFGAARLREFPPSAADHEGIRVVVISGLHLTDDPVRAYVDATSRELGADLVIWPEGAIPGYLQEEPSTRAMLSAQARGHAALLTGGRRYRGTGEERRYFNSAFLLDSNGAVVGLADKQRLVPVAEFSPVPRLHALRRPYTPALGPPVPLEVAGLRLGPLICWDVLFDGLSRSLAMQDVDLLVNLSSDRDLGAGRAQLVAFARFRAIETRRWLARASGTGESLVIDPAGRVLEHDRFRLAPDPRRPRTFYVRHGKLVPVAAALLLGLLALVDLVLTPGRRARGPSRPASVPTADRQAVSDRL